MARPAGGALPYPVLLLATVATLTRQAAQLGFLPRMRVVHTSGTAEGQVYISRLVWK